MPDPMSYAGYESLDKPANDANTRLAIWLVWELARRQEREMAAGAQLTAEFVNEVVSAAGWEDLATQKQGQRPSTRWVMALEYRIIKASAQDVSVWH